MTRHQTDLLLDVYEAAVALKAAWEQQEAAELQERKPVPKQKCYAEAKDRLSSVLVQWAEADGDETTTDNMFLSLFPTKLLARVT